MEGVSEEVETLGEALPLLNKGYMQFSFSVTPPPRVSGSAPGHISQVSIHIN